MGDRGKRGRNEYEEPPPSDFPEHLKDLLSNAVYILIPIHGVYDDITPPTYTLPANMCIFETQMIGDLCRTSIIPDLHAMLKKRTHFLNTLMVRELNYKYINIIKNLTLYEPGDSIYKRYLLRGPADESLGVLSAYFPSGAYADLIDVKLDANTLVNTESLIQIIIAAYPYLNRVPIVLFFASCAVWGHIPDARVESIMEHQANMSRKFMGYTPVAPGGGIGVENDPNYGNHKLYRTTGPKVKKWLKRSTNSNTNSNKNSNTNNVGDAPIPGTRGGRRIRRQCAQKRKTRRKSRCFR